MGHTPNAKKGMEAMCSMNEDILADIATQADIAMAKQDRDRDASLAAIRERHANELKAAKRNHKHRAKKIKRRMKEFEDMDPMDLAERFKNGVPEDTVSGNFIERLYDHQLIGVDFGNLEKRILASMMIPTSRMIMRSRQEGKMVDFMQLYDASDENKPLRHQWPAAFNIETAS